jgi:hypothetical protein
VQVTPQDVYLQYARAVAQHLHPVPRMSSCVRAGLKEQQLYRSDEQHLGGIFWPGHTGAWLRHNHAA